MARSVTRVHGYADALLLEPDLFPLLGRTRLERVRPSCGLYFQAFLLAFLVLDHCLNLLLHRF
jgi:hypothetical protein